jgi:lipopolysaccharide transport system ATP-binding protein
MKYELLADNMKVFPNFHVFSSNGTCAFITSDSKIDPNSSLKENKGIYIATCNIPANYLNDEVYFISFALTTIKPSIHVHFFEKDAMQVHVIDKIDGTITRNGYSGVIPGVIRPALDWSSEKI